MSVPRLIKGRCQSDSNLCGTYSSVVFHVLPQWLIHSLNLQERILEKTMSLKNPLIEETGMLPALQECKKNVDKNQNIINETLYLRENLAEKRAPYTSVATHGAKLYEISQRVSVLCPEYHMSLSEFMGIFTSMVQSRYRGKGITGKYHYSVRVWCIAFLYAFSVH